MATPKIGNIECFDIIGRPPEMQTAVEFETIKGYHGVEIETIGTPGVAFELIAREVDTHDVIESWIAALAALAGGDGVTITLGDGSTFDNCYIGSMDGSGVVVQSKRAAYMPAEDATGFDCLVIIRGFRSPI